MKNFRFNQSRSQADAIKFQFNDLLSLGVVLVTFIVMTACGGGGGGGASTSPARTTTATLSSGEIEGFGSIIVNGVEYNTENAEFEIENQASGSQNDLREGMQVTIEGTTNDDGLNGTATRVHFEDNLEGPIASVTPSNTGLSKELQIMGKRVRVEQGVTQFDNADAPAFQYSNIDTAVGNVVEVSGHEMADGSLQATFIQKKADTMADFLAGAGELEFKGNVSNLTATTFQIGSLTIDYSTALVDGTLADGILVEVKSLDDNLADGMTADSVEVRPGGLGRDDIAKAEVEGIIASLNTGGQTFMIDGQMVNYANATFRGGFEDELADNIKVEAEGPLAAGMLNATKVTFKESIKFEANLTGSAGGNLTLQGLSGISVAADDSITRFDGFTALTDLVAGDNLRVRARPSGNGDTMVATRIILRSSQPNDRLIVQGRVTDFSNPTVNLLGSLPGGLVTIDTNEIINNSSQDNNPGDSDFEIEDTPVNQDAFFAALVPGDTVKARARLADAVGGGDAKTWQAIEIEVEDDNN